MTARRVPEPDPGLDRDLEAVLAVLDQYGRRIEEVLGDRSVDPWAALGIIHLLARARAAELVEPLRR